MFLRFKYSVVSFSSKSIQKSIQNLNPDKNHPENGRLKKSNLLDKTNEFILDKCLSKKIICFISLYIYNDLNKIEPVYFYKLQSRFKLTIKMF